MFVKIIAVTFLLFLNMAINLCDRRFAGDYSLGNDSTNSLKLSTNNTVLSKTTKHYKPLLLSKYPFTINPVVKEIASDVRAEAAKALTLALQQKEKGNMKRAEKLIKHAHFLDPANPVILTTYGELVEQQGGDNLLFAEQLYYKAIINDPTDLKALALRKRILPLVEDIDQKSFNRIDLKKDKFLQMDKNEDILQRLKKELHVQHIYHSNAIEGNTMNLSQTRSILETRVRVEGKSVVEHKEVLGLDLALKYVYSNLLRHCSVITLDDILQIHLRVLGLVDKTEAGRLRKTQVYIAGDATPPPSEVEDLMRNFVDWLNSDETADLHPIEFAALAHWKLVHIHPFYDGNGRTARLLMNLILMCRNYTPAIVRIEQRGTYYKRIKEANDGDVRPFVRFIAHSVEQTLDDLLRTIQQIEETAQNYRHNRVSVDGDPVPPALGGPASVIYLGTAPSYFDHACTDDKFVRLMDAGRENAHSSADQEPTLEELLQWFVSRGHHSLPEITASLPSVLPSTAYTRTAERDSCHWMVPFLPARFPLLGSTNHSALRPTLPQRQRPTRLSSSTSLLEWSIVLAALVIVTAHLPHGTFSLKRRTER